MKRYTGLFALVALVTVAACDVEAPTELAPSPNFSTVTASSDAIPDRYIVRLSDDVPSAAAASASMMRGLRGEVHFTYETLFKGFAVTLPGQALNAIQRNPLVASIEQDGVVTKIATTQTGATWGLDRIDARSGLDDTYTYGVNGAGVDVYILDTGILSSHVDFGGRVRNGFTAVDDNVGTEDCDGHGTHVAGTVGGAQWGVAKGVNLVPVRVLDCSGSGTWAGVIAGMDWVAANASGPSVANMSLGGGQSSSIDAAVANMHNSGVTVVVAAGNSTADACGSSPAAAPEAITVGATTSSDAPASYSNYGECVDIFAPGSGITSAWYTSPTATNTISGTSMASPHTAGAAALWLQTDPTLTPSQVATALTGSATEGAIEECTRETGGGKPRTVCGPMSSSVNLLLYVDPAMTGGGGGGGGNSAPTASFTYECSELACDFFGVASDSDGTVASYAWSFGATTLDASYNFTNYGNYTVTLTVTDDDGATGSATQSVSLVDPNSNELSNVDYAYGKSRGKNAIRIDGITPGNPGSLTMVNQQTGNEVVNVPTFNPGTVYSTNEKGAATYDVTVCNTANQCSTFALTYS